MIYIFSLLAMIFFHIVDDYYLQGVLAKMKQKQWWKDNAPDKMYKNDWLPALIAHAFSWTFMIMLPAAAAILILGAGIAPLIMYCVAFAMNWFLHAFVDHYKANDKTINLIDDQFVHLLQIISTWLLVVLPTLIAAGI
jgi:hypothetical protein